MPLLWSNDDRSKDNRDMNDMKSTSDYGCDPLGNGMFRMVPSGDIVDFEERNRRLPGKAHPPNDCLGLSWEEIKRRQGGTLRRGKL